MQFQAYLQDDDDAAYLPSITEIWETARQIREGELYVSEGSDRRWRDWREAKRLGDEYETAGRLPEDDCELPAWFGA